MTEFERVQKGLECCAVLDSINGKDRCNECPYNKISINVDDCRRVLNKEALEILKDLKEENENLKQTLQSIIEGVFYIN